MNKWLLGAGALSAAALAVHVVLAANVHAGLVLAVHSPILRTFSSVTWQAVTGMLVVNTGALFVAASKSETARPLAAIVACQYLIWSGLFVFYSATYLGSILQTPQWIVFALIASLALIGAYRNSTLPEEP